LISAGIQVLYDDRDVSAGEKFATADLIGIPWRFIVSEKTADNIEIKKRSQQNIEARIVSFDDALRVLHSS
jgi:prolyl-tRNA synthetase